MPFSDEAILLGRILGEIYRMQRRSGMPCCASNSEVFGLLNGFEHILRDKCSRITEEQFKAFATVIDRYTHPDTVKDLKGYYDIEHELDEMGVSRGDAITLVRYFRAAGHINPTLDQLNSSRSPIELKNIEVDDVER